MSNDWSVHIEYRPGDMRTYVYIMRRTDIGKLQFLTKGGEIIVTKDDGNGNGYGDGYGNGD